ncbi:nucleosidase [Kineosporia sp. NBRC 101677]|uniref:nucleosidase n=1 Tax=Kineosporia sp. NBRC 101677 TaxID=3032197 RepID=UPI0024A5FB9C|nr:nucleosidase [Kineosporia sp. NBRC 101677]GLY17059.1 nucleosidase [Kineosporia sp. NBRC 101677]
MAFWRTGVDRPAPVRRPSGPGLRVERDIAVAVTTEQLIGTVSSDRPLLVVAVAEEAQFLDGRLPVLITGIGKINTTGAVLGAVAGGPRPASLINLGTAGALRPGLHGLHEISTVVQHDLDTDLLLRLTGNTYGAPIHLSAPGDITLASGDTFVADGAQRDALAQRAHLVDMEGYAVAAAAQRLGLPVRLIKQVSDDADENSTRTWPETVAACAQVLADWVARESGA